MYWLDPNDHILKVSCQYLYYWLRYRGYRGSGGKYFDDDDEEDDDDDDDDDDDVDDEGQNEEQSVLWESGLILKVSWQYLYYWPRYRGYRGGGGKHFDDVDEDDDDVDLEGENERDSVLWESEHILKVSCQYLYYWLRYRRYRGKGGNYFYGDVLLVEGRHGGRGQATP